ncbi:hypothetical protein HN911_00475 [Candidatus Bathyarchaeota archaeon]|nr:hypothetical protein [Candidatus Bathyarchaeota archaeon]MBT7912934.1 hypothetical protein [Candidatus Bathyarchaeota archaeon]
MAKIRFNCEGIAALSKTYPEKVGKWDAKKKVLKTPDGQSLKPEIMIIGRAKAEALKKNCPVKLFLKSLDLAELSGSKKTEGASPAGAGLSAVSPRQAVNPASWGAFFKRNTDVDPEKVKKAVDAGVVKANDAIEKGRAKKEEAALKEKAKAEKATRKAKRTQAVRALRKVKKGMSEEEFAELIREV